MVSIILRVHIWGHLANILNHRKANEYFIAIRIVSYSMQIRVQLKESQGWSGIKICTLTR